MTTATITWNDPTARTDGTALVLSALNVMDDIGDGNGPQLVGSVAPGVQSFNTPTLAPGSSHTYTVVALDNSTPPENSAPSSPAVTVTVPPAQLAPPNPPTNVAVTLNNGPAPAAAAAAVKK